MSRLWRFCTIAAFAYNIRSTQFTFFSLRSFGGRIFCHSYNTNNFMIALFFSPYVFVISLKGENESTPILSIKKYMHILGSLAIGMVYICSVSTISGIQTVNGRITATAGISLWPRWIKSDVYVNSMSSGSNEYALMNIRNIFHTVCICVDEWERTKGKKYSEHQNDYEIIIRKNEQVSRI